MFEPGQLVECIDGTFPPGIFDVFNTLPRKGQRYTVRDLVPGMDSAGNVTCAVYLEGVENLPDRHGIEPGFHVTRFREVEEEEADGEFAESEGEEWKG